MNIKSPRFKLHLILITSVLAVVLILIYISRFIAGGTAQSMFIISRGTLSNQLDFNTKNVHNGILPELPKITIVNEKIGIYSPQDRHIKIYNRKGQIISEISLQGKFDEQIITGIDYNSSQGYLVMTMPALDIGKLFDTSPDYSDAIIRLYSVPSESLGVSVLGPLHILSTGDGLQFGDVKYIDSDQLFTTGSEVYKITSGYIELQEDMNTVLGLELGDGGGERIALDNKTICTALITEDKKKYCIKFDNTIENEDGLVNINRYRLYELTEDKPVREYVNIIDLDIDRQNKLLVLLTFEDDEFHIHSIYY